MNYNTLAWARYYVSMGWHVIPLNPGEKSPLLGKNQIQEYRKRVPTDSELRAWFDGTESNIGIITGLKNKPVVVDIDSQAGVSNYQKFTDSAKYSVPVVKTPRGYHLYFNAQSVPPRTRIGFIEDCDLKSEGGYVVAPPSINGNGGIYSWVRHPKDYTLLPLPEKFIRRELGQDTLPAHPWGLSEGTRDESMYSTAVSLYKGGMPKSNAIEIIKSLAANCNPPFPLDEAIRKVDSAYDNLPRERDITQEMDEWIADSEGLFKITDIFNYLKPSKRDQKIIRKYIRTLIKNNVIERVSSKGNGIFRRVINNTAIIDFKNAPDDIIFDIDWPKAFYFTDWFKLYPGNIAIIAGSPNSGKTALALNLIRLNMYKYRVNYFSCEITAGELKARLNEFEGISAKDFNFNAYELSTNFADLVEENALNIIDYWQPSSDGAFYAIAEDLDKIHKKLNGTGLAIVCVQKKRGAELGRGAEFSLERPRLYISMDFQKLSLVKVKSPMPNIQPNGKEFRFKLTSGCNFSDVEETTDMPKEN